MAIKDSKSFIYQLVEHVVQALDPEKVILFGSQATGLADEESDVDLLVIMETDLDRLDRTWEARRLLRGKRHGPLDIIILTPSEYEKMKQGGYSLIQVVEEEGIVLYERNLPLAVLFSPQLPAESLI